MAKHVRVNDGSKNKTVDRQAYITAKTKDLQQLGYGTLTEQETSAALVRALKGEINDPISKLIKQDLV